MGFQSPRGIRDAVLPDREDSDKNGLTPSTVSAFAFGRKQVKYDCITSFLFKDEVSPCS